MSAAEITRASRAARLATLPLLAVLAASAQAAPVPSEWLGVPRGTTAMGPVGLAPDGTAVAVTPSRTTPGTWDLVRFTGTQWGAPAPALVPAGMRPVAVGADGAVLAMGPSVEGDRTVVRAALLTGGGWNAVPAALAGSPTVEYAGRVGADGTLLMASSDGASVQVVAVDGTRVQAVTAPGTGLPDLNLNESGDALVAWRAASGAGETLLYSVRPAGGAWSAVRRGPVARTVPSAALSFDADITGDGTGLLAWAAGAAGKNRVWWSIARDPRAGWNPASPVSAAPIPGAVVEGLIAAAGGESTLVWSTPRATQTAARPPSSPRWTLEGTVPSAPGRGTAARAPVTPLTDRAGMVAVAWAPRGSVSLAVKPFMPGGWTAPQTFVTPPGPVSVTAAVASTGLVASWSVDSGPATGRAGVVAAGSAPARVSRVVAGRARDGRVTVVASAEQPGWAVVTVTRVGTRTPVVARTVALVPGTNTIPLGSGQAALRRGAAYEVRVSGASAGTSGAPVASLRVPARG